MAANPAHVWLKENGLRVCAPEPGAIFRRWYWFRSVKYGKPVTDPEDLPHVLPDVIWTRLKERTADQEVKLYQREEDAMNDFAQAFWAAVRAGELSIPEPRGSPDEISF